jgi:hypothetical protein
MFESHVHDRLTNRRRNLAVARLLMLPRTMHRMLFVFLIGCVVGEAGDHAGDTSVIASDGPNLIINSDFDYGFVPGGATTTSVGTPIAQQWYGGPGQGATAHYEVILDASSGYFPRYLRIAWSVAASAGESQHLPAFRYTFLENYLGTGNLDHDVRAFYGQTVEVSFWARIASGAISVVPIVWQSWDSQTPGVAGVKGLGYELFESSGQPNVVAVAQGYSNPNAPVTVTTAWQRFTKRFTIPDNTGKSLTPDAYTGFGFDFDNIYGPVLDIAHVEAHLLADPATSPTARAQRSQLVRELYESVFGFAQSKDSNDYWTDAYNPAAGIGCRAIAQAFVTASPLRGLASAATVATDPALTSYIRMLYRAILPAWDPASYNTALIAGWRVTGSLTMDQLDGIFLDNDEFKARCAAAGVAF